MAFLASQVIRKVQENLPSFYPILTDIDATPQTEALALDLLNETHSEIVLAAGLYAIEDVAIDLTAGTREYVLNPDVFRVKSATYFSGPEAAASLNETSIDKLDYTARGWRYLSGSGTPTQYYEEGGNVGLFVTPNRSTVAGYPVVVLNALMRHSLTTLDSLLPPQVPNLDAWVFGLCVRWCIRNDRDSIALYAPLAQRSLESLKSFTQTKLQRDKPTVKARYPRVGYR